MLNKKERQMYRRIFNTAVLIAPIFFAFCQSERRCQYKPAPIFEAGLPHVVQYNFEKKAAQSLESLMLDTNVLLEIYQEVCHETRQEYRFTVKGDYAQQPDSNWIKEAARQLVFLSSFSEKHAPLKMWADAIEAQRPDMRLGEDLELERNVFVKVDRVLSKEQSTLLLVLTQK
jgi:hypothetical protein